MKSFLDTILRWRHPSNSRLQILSDLHLEVGQQYSSYTFPVSAPFLILAGDIGRLVDYDHYLEFLEAQVSRYEKVFLVLGNHEFYGLDYDSGLEKARQLSAEPSLAGKLVLLDRARWDDPNSNLTLLGCTLCSAIPKDAYSIVEAKINDFNKILRWTCSKHSEIHAREISWLRDQVAQVNSASQGKPNAERQLLIVTHHAPSIEGTSRPEHVSNPWTPAFATDLVGGEGWAGVKTWVFGHTHYSTDLVRNGIRLVANQRGYVLPGSEKTREEGKKTKKNAHEFHADMVITV